MSTAVKNYFQARPCPCGNAVCKQWVVNYPELRITEPEAMAAAALLNAMQTNQKVALAPLQPTPEMLDAAGISRIAAIGVWTNMMKARPK